MEEHSTNSSIASTTIDRIELQYNIIGILCTDGSPIVVAIKISAEDSSRYKCTELKKWILQKRHRMNSASLFQKAIEVLNTALFAKLLLQIIFLDYSPVIII
jgi:hypothetical protein